MDSTGFKYDVAVSFLTADEKLALQIKHLLEERVSCFVFTEEQKRLSASDGESLLNQVFSKEARVVVVLHRDAWGKTPWTRIEETAIRNRGFDKGYDFVVFVPLDSPVNPPMWLPKNRIWSKIEPWGIEGLVSVIERKVQEYGGEVKEVTVLDQALSAKQEIESHNNREQILESLDGLILAKAEFNVARELVKKYVDDIKKSITDWHFTIKQDTPENLTIISFGHTLSIQWNQAYSNSLRGTYIYVSLHDGVFGDVFDKPIEILINRLQFDINEFDQKGWSENKTRAGFITTAELINKYFSSLIENIKRKRKEERY